MTYGNQLLSFMKRLGVGFKQTPYLKTSFLLFSTSHLFRKGHILTFRIVILSSYKLPVFTVFLSLPFLKLLT